MKKFSVMLEEIMLLEVKIRGSKPREGSHVLSNGKNVYVWNNEREFERIVPFINRDLGTDFDAEDDIDMWYDEGSKIVYGTIERGALQMPGESSYKPSSGDKQTAKVLKALGLHSTGRRLSTFTNDYHDQHDHEFETRRDEFNKALGKKTFYHGTCTTYIEDMLKVGIKPDSGSTQFDNIIHSDKVFITTEQDKAMFHATTAANNNNSFPVIITMSIPDESKLVSDYDVVIDTLGADSEEASELGYADIWYQMPGTRGNGQKAIGDDLTSRYGKKIDRLSTDVGIFGYKGRIPASFFKKLLADTDVIEDAMYENYFEIGEEFSLAEMQATEAGNHRQFDYWDEKRPDRFVSDLEDRWDEMVEENEDEDY